MTSLTRIATVSFSTLLLGISLSGFAAADYMTPQDAAERCAKEKGDFRQCCDDNLEGTKKEVKICLKLVPEIRKKMKEEKAAKVAAKKAKADAAKPEAQDK